MPSPFFLSTRAWVNTLLGPTHWGQKPGKNGIWPSAWAQALGPDVSFSSNTQEWHSPGARYFEVPVP